MKSYNSRRSTVVRRKEILGMLSKAGHIWTHELSKIFEVSEVTIRNDIELFESRGLLIRSRGGARNANGPVGTDFQIAEKDRMNYSTKACIGKKAAGLVKGGETIILDSGTTTLEIAKNLNPGSPVNVITNAFNIANQLLDRANINIIIPGGILCKNSYSLVGPIAEKSLRNLYVDKVFLGVDGFDVAHGAYTPNIDEASLNQVMIEIAKEVILVMDSSKFSRRSLAFICPTKKITHVVTDSRLSPEDHQRLLDSGVEVILA